MTTNLFRRLLDLIPGPAPLLVGTVSDTFADGTAQVELPGGGTLRVRNPLASAAADRVFVQGDAITGPAPDLDLVEIEIA